MTDVDGGTLRAWRVSRSWDVPKLAQDIRRVSRDVAVSVADHDGLVRMIYGWERGDHAISERYRLLYAAALRIRPEQLGRGPGGTHPEHSGTQLPVLPLDLGLAHVMMPGDVLTEEKDMDRRGFGLAAMGLLAGALVSSSKVPANVTAKHLRELRRNASAIWTRDQHVGGSGQLREAVTQYTTARAMLDYSSYSTKVGAELQAVTSGLAACAGFAAHDAGQQPLARGLLTEAGLLAAGDALLSTRAYGLLALQSNALGERDRGRAREALRFLDMAEAAARHEPSPRIHALIWMRRAAAAGILDDDLTVCRAITNALRELDRGDHPADPAWSGFVDQAEVTAHEAMARVAQGKPAPAAVLFRDVLTDRNLPPRNRALYTAQLAGSLHAAGDRAEAVSAGLEVLGAVEGDVRSARVLNELRAVRHSTDPDSEFAARYDAALAS
jgi:hypothetical protein